MDPTAFNQNCKLGKKIGFQNSNTSTVASGNSGLIRHPKNVHYYKRVTISRETHAKIDNQSA